MHFWPVWGQENPHKQENIQTPQRQTQGPRNRTCNLAVRLTTLRWQESSFCVSVHHLSDDIDVLLACAALAHHPVSLHTPLTSVLHVYVKINEEWIKWAIVSWGNYYPQHWPPHAELTVDWATNQPVTWMNAYEIFVPIYCAGRRHLHSIFSHNKNCEARTYFCPAHARHKIT